MGGGAILAGGRGHLGGADPGQLWRYSAPTGLARVHPPPLRWKWHCHDYGWGQNGFSCSKGRSPGIFWGEGRPGDLHQGDGEWLSGGRLWGRQGYYGAGWPGDCPWRDLYRQPGQHDRSQRHPGYPAKYQCPGDGSSTGHRAARGYYRSFRTVQPALHHLRPPQYVWLLV